MNEALMRTAERLADREYAVSMSVSQTADGRTLYMAKTPELVGCMAQGETLEEAIKNLRDARVDYITDSLENGSPIPDPSPQRGVAQRIDTADTAIHLDALGAGLRIQTFIPAGVHSEPVVPRIRQSSPT